MTTVCVEVAELCILTVIVVRGAGLVWKTAVLHGSSIMTEKFAAVVKPSTVIVSVSA